MMIHCRLIRALNFRDSERLKICTSFGTANWGFISVGFSDAEYREPLMAATMALPFLGLPPESRTSIKAFA